VSRKLTPGEMGMVQAMFATNAGFERARIFPYNYWWPFPNKRAMTPTGDIFFDTPQYRDDYSLPTVPLHLRSLFMHESTHLYQWYVLGQLVIFRGPFDRNYEYVIQPGKKFSDYGLEQMGQIVEDYHTLANGGAVPGKALADYAGLLPLAGK